VIGLINSSPFHLIDNYRKNSEAREAILRTNELRENLHKYIEENVTLKQELAKLKEEPQKPNDIKEPNQTGDKQANLATTLGTAASTQKCPPPTKIAPMAQSIGLSTLSFFKPVQGQKDQTRPASLSLNDFKIINNKETVNFQFNIVNLLGGDVKLAGHILVIMKNELQIQVYPMNALNSSSDTQINYNSGEPFATQRFRPVDASFMRPKRSGNYIFTVFIFARNGDLLHYQSTTMAVK
jgi:hypothetical protein